MLAVSGHMTESMISCAVQSSSICSLACVSLHMEGFTFADVILVVGQTGQNFIQ